MTQALGITCEHVCKTYPGATAPALQDVSLNIGPNEFVTFVGASGCGKSTLARVLTMIEPPSAGQLLYRGQDVSQADPALAKLRRRKVQIIFQNPYASLNPRKRIGDILEEPLLINTRLDARERRERGQAMMARVGLRPEHYSRYPHMFSGGQRQRIAIARGLMLDPEILVADEAVSALDVSVRAQVLNLMQDLQRDLGLSYVFISHDLAVVEHRLEGRHAELRVAFLDRLEQFVVAAAVLPLAVDERPALAAAEVGAVAAGAEPGVGGLAVDHLLVGAAHQRRVEHVGVGHRFGSHGL